MCYVAMREVTESFIADLSSHFFIRLSHSHSPQSNNFFSLVLLSSVPNVIAVDNSSHALPRTGRPFISFAIRKIGSKWRAAEREQKKKTNKRLQSKLFVWLLFETFFLLLWINFFYVWRICEFIFDSIIISLQEQESNKKKICCWKNYIIDARWEFGLEFSEAIACTYSLSPVDWVQPKSVFVLKNLRIQKRRFSRNSFSFNNSKSSKTPRLRLMIVLNAIKLYFISHNKRAAIKTTDCTVNVFRRFSVSFHERNVLHLCRSMQRNKPNAILCEIAKFFMTKNIEETAECNSLRSHGFQ